MSFVQGQDWESAGWGSRGPATGAAKSQQLNAARRQGNVVAEAKREFSFQPLIRVSLLDLRAL